MEKTDDVFENHLYNRLVRVTGFDGDGSLIMEKARELNVELKRLTVAMLEGDARLSFANAAALDKMLDLLDVIYEEAIMIANVATGRR